MLKSRYVKNLLTLIGSTSFAQAIPVLLAPILSYLYSPEEYGVLAVFVAITVIIGNVSTLKYELALFNNSQSQVLSEITKITVLLSLLICITLSVALYVVFDFLVNYYDKINVLRPYLIYIPLCAFLVGLFNILMVLNNKLSRYKTIAISNILKSTLLISSQIVTGLMSFGSLGLVISQIFAIGCTNVNLIRKHKFLRIPLSTNKVKEILSKYIRYPKFSAPSTLLNTMSLYVLNFLLLTFYGPFIVGVYAFSNRLIGTPSLIIGKSIGQVFIQEITDRHQSEISRSEMLALFLKTLKSLFILGVIIFALIYFLVNFLVTTFLAEEWSMVSSLIKALVPLFFVRFISSTLSPVIDIFGRQHILLIFNFLLLFLTVGVFIICTSLTLGVVQTITILALIISALYIYLLFESYKTIKII